MVNIGYDPSLDDINRKEILASLLSKQHVKLNDLQKPVYTALFNYYLDRLLDVWKTSFYNPNGIEVLSMDRDGECIRDDLNRPYVDMYYSTHVFYDIKDGNVIVVSIYDLDKQM